MVTTNIGRALYIVYSLLTIPIITILVSLMSDSLLSKFQKSAERWGVKRSEPKKKKSWRSYFRFKRKKRKPGVSEDIDVEMGPPVDDHEILREEILEEMESLEDEAENEVERELGDTGITEDLEMNMGVRRRTGSSEGIEDFSEENVEHEIIEEES